MNVATGRFHTHLARKLALKIRRRRRLHCFCLGAAKTGTTSLAAMFQQYYRSAHEPQPAALIHAVTMVLGHGSCSRPRSQEISAWLTARDRDLGLEIEASHPLGYMAPWLPRVFPEACFIITLRDPTAWLRSRLNFHFYKQPPTWQQYRDMIWSRWHNGYYPEEGVLKERALFSLDGYLGQYSEQYRILFDSIPEGRRLIVRTEGLDSASAEIAAFLGINPDSIEPQHANALQCENDILDMLPADFVSRRIDENCRWLRAYL